MDGGGFLDADGSLELGAVFLEVAIDFADLKEGSETAFGRAAEIGLEVVEPIFALILFSW